MYSRKHSPGRSRPARPARCSLLRPRNRRLPQALDPRQRVAQLHLLEPRIYHVFYAGNGDGGFLDVGRQNHLARAAGCLLEHAQLLVKR